MSEFSEEWLALREPVDHRARSEALANWVLDALPRDGPVHILDLGCGTGSNLRYLRKRGRKYLPVSWTLVDGEQALLARIPGGAGVVTRQRNLAVLTAELFQGQTLVTASALLDLVSGEWIRELTAHCRSIRAAMLFALTYDGRIECAPAEPEDAMVGDLVNRHQHGDKGFGPALGPEASAFAEQCFAAAGYEVRREASDWVLRSERALQSELIKGWADAARQVAPSDAARIADWQRRRLAHVAAGRSRLLVGHQDLGAILPV